LGRAVALRLAAPGVGLHLGGRDPARLEEIASLCRAKEATAVPRQIDVTDREGMAAWIGQAGRLDLVIANAGISAGSFGGAPEGADQVRAIFATNLEGALNTALPALEVMARQEPGPDGWRGRIACIASIAGFIALPHAPSYCAAKAALDRWTVATAPQARRLGVRLVSICPGYVRTPMTASNRFPMPGLIDADRAATLILRGIASGQERVVFPGWFGWFTRLSGLLPPRWIENATKRVPGKG
jgi:NAD(P)-dependent dehydrogenase (short-subunit alcohol dehydrogenase family)